MNRITDITSQHVKLIQKWSNSLKRTINMNITYLIQTNQIRLNVAVYDKM